MNGFHGRIKNHSNQNSQFEFEIISDTFFSRCVKQGANFFSKDVFMIVFLLEWVIILGVHKVSQRLFKRNYICVKCHSGL